jgi:hypothetical protein
MILKEYLGEYAANKPDFIHANIEFIGTCGACPEQYDATLVDPETNKRYQVGYVRLRYGNLYCAFPDVGGKNIYEHKFWDHAGWLGTFPTQASRKEHLEAIAHAINQELWDSHAVT